MYLLYYFLEDIDASSVLEHIAVSENRAKLEALREELLAPSQKFNEEAVAYREKCENYYKSIRKKIRAFLKANIDCVKEIRPQLRLAGKSLHPDAFAIADKDWMDYSVQKTKEDMIDIIVSSHFSIFYKGFSKSRAEFIDESKVSEPMLEIEPESFEFPHAPNPYYSGPANLVIEEIKAI